MRGGWCAIVLAACFGMHAAERPWQRIAVPTYEEAYRQFRDPPPEYGLTMWWWWNGPMTESDIRRDLRDMRTHGVRAVMIWAMAGLEVEYLSPVWFERIRFAVAEAASLGMRVWLMDEGGYPSGFAGGKVTREYPHLGMRMLTVDRFPAPAGARVQMHLTEGFLAASAIDPSGRAVRLAASGDTLQWTAPEGQWEIVAVSEGLSTSPTRYVHSPGYRKDTTFSLIDLMNPAAVDRFLSDVYAAYEKHIGHEFGRTVLGFMSDEPNYSGLPWTPALPVEFRKRKRYDLVPLLPEMAAAKTPEARRALADYREVWTSLLADGIFRRSAEWCGNRGLEYMTHLWGEDQMKTLVPHNGDYFTLNRWVHIPGVDAVWREIWPQKRPYFPKLASSAAHLYGRPRAFTESLAAYGAGLTLGQAKWVLDYQFVRGINLVQTMAYLSSEEEYRPYLAPPSWSSSPLWPYFGQLAAYANRLSYILSVGQPTASTAILYPIASGWLEDFGPEAAMAQTAQRLLEEQRDFDFISEEGIRSLTKLKDGRLMNASGQAYDEVLISPGAAVSEETRQRVSRIRKAPAPPPIHLQPPAKDLRCLKRRLADVDVFFLFNEGENRVDSMAVIQSEGAPEWWDPVTGERSAVESLPREGSRGARIRLVLEPSESKLLVFAPRPAAPSVHLERPSRVHTTLEGEWRVELNGAVLTGELKSWHEWGHRAFWGVGRYRKEFSYRNGAGAAVLDLGEVRYAASVRLNGVDLGRRAWAPFRWRLDGALREGVNLLEIEVANTRANEVAGNPAKLLELEKLGWAKMSLLARYLPFDEEMLPSGLLGPVRILVESQR